METISSHFLFLIEEFQVNLVNSYYYLEGFSDSQQHPIDLNIF